MDSSRGGGPSTPRQSTNQLLSPLSEPRHLETPTRPPPETPVGPLSGSSRTRQPSTSPLGQSPTKRRSRAKANYSEGVTLRQYVWGRIYENLKKHPNSWYTMTADEKLSVEGLLKNLLPEEGHHYLVDSLDIWTNLTRCSMRVSDHQISRIIPIKHHSVMRNEPHGLTFFMTTWRLSADDFTLLSEYLADHEKTFSELRTWMELIRSFGPRPGGFLTVRYIGSCEVERWRYLQYNLRYMDAECLKPLSGVLPEFLTAVEIALPQVARTVQTYALPVTLRTPEERVLSRHIGIILLEFFGVPWILNRHEDSAISIPMESSPFKALNTHFHGLAATPSTVCPEDVTDGLTVLFNDIRSISRSGPQPRYLALTSSKCSVLLNQATPYMYKGIKALLVLLGNSMYLSEYLFNNSYLGGDNPDAVMLKSIVKNISWIEGIESFRPDLFAYYCFAPWLTEVDLDVKVVSSTVYCWRLSSIANKRIELYVALSQTSSSDGLGHHGEAGDTDHHVVHGRDCSRGTLSNLGRPVLACSPEVELDKIYFIHIPVLDPGRHRYMAFEEYDDGVFIAKFTQLLMQLAVLAADVAVRVLDDPYWTPFYPDSLSVCQEVLRRLKETLDSEEGRPFRDEIDATREKVKAIGLKYPDMFPTCM
ncbi:hypothetical protein F4776DRAFT_333307 [Hypoxylon sp. NC0597]|nr:hypothetical protein F4776DRAFT_333307 [Hypoxylon sp. NC0597]